MQAGVITGPWLPPVALVRLFATLTGSEQQVRTADQQQELTRLEEQWRTARINGDVGFLESLYAPELKLTGTDGSIIDRDADIAGFRSGAIKPDSIEREDMRILVYGDAAIVTGRDNLSGRYNGAVGSGSVRFTHIYIRRQGRWQLVASQGTWLQRK